MSPSAATAASGTGTAVASGRGFTFFFEPLFDEEPGADGPAVGTDSVRLEVIFVASCADVLSLLLLLLLLPPHHDDSLPMMPPPTPLLEMEFRPACSQAQWLL